MALTAYAVWPTWESSALLSESMAALLDAYRAYFQALTKACLSGGHSSQELESLRLAARLARSNMEASVERYRAEPGGVGRAVGPADVDARQFLHRFAHAIMTIGG